MMYCSKGTAKKVNTLPNIPTSGFAGCHWNGTVASKVHGILRTTRSVICTSKDSSVLDVDHTLLPFVWCGRRHPLRRVTGAPTHSRTCAWSSDIRAGHGSVRGVAVWDSVR